MLAAMTDPTGLVPRDKYDLDAARRAVEAGWPAVEPVAGELVAWCLDSNWPVAHVLAPFLGSLGPPVADYLRPILQGWDAPAKYHVLTSVVGAMPPSGVAGLAGELRRLAEAPSPDEVEEQLADLARSQLARLDES
jgi:hypothetical protein